MLLQLAKVDVQFRANKSRAKGKDDKLWRDIHEAALVFMCLIGDSQGMLLLLLSFRDSDDLCKFECDCELEDSEEGSADIDIMDLLRFLCVLLLLLLGFLLFDEEANENQVNSFMLWGWFLLRLLTANA